MSHRGRVNSNRILTRESALTSRRHCPLLSILEGLTHWVAWFNRNRIGINAQWAWCGNKKCPHSWKSTWHNGVYAWLIAHACIIEITKRDSNVHCKWYLTLNLFAWSCNKSTTQHPPPSTTTDAKIITEKLSNEMKMRAHFSHHLWSPLLVFDVFIFFSFTSCETTRTTYFLNGLSVREHEDKWAMMRHILCIPMPLAFAYGYGINWSIKLASAHQNKTSQFFQVIRSFARH